MRDPAGVFSSSAQCKSASIQCGCRVKKLPPIIDPLAVLRPGRGAAYRRYDPPPQATSRQHPVSVKVTYGAVLDFCWRVPIPPVQQMQISLQALRLTNAHDL